MVHPLFFVPSLILKNASVYNAVIAAQAYGWHRIYRRLLEGMRSLHLPNDQRLMLSSNIKSVIRSPSLAHEALMNNDTVVFIENYSKFIIEKSGIDKKIPPFLVTLATYWLKKTPAGKWFDLFTKSKSK